MTIQLLVPGIIYSEFIEDSATPEEENWPRPTARRIGRGMQYVYEVTDAQRLLILSHVDDYAACSTGYDPDDRGRAAGRTALLWLQKHTAMTR